jgi:hypothetical protein
MLKESTYPLLPHIRLQACGIGLAQVDQDQAVEDVGETLVHVERIDRMKRLTPHSTWWHRVPHREITRLRRKEKRASHGAYWHRSAQEAAS